MSSRASLTPRHSDKIIKIYRDDPRNNKKFLERHPNYVVINKNRPRKHKKKGHHSVSKHKTKIKSKKHRHHPPTHPKLNAPGKNVVDNVFDPDIEELDELDSDEDLELQDDEGMDEEDKYSAFLFHEAADELHSPEADLLSASQPRPIATSKGSTDPYRPNGPVVTQVTIDPTSFIVQKDAQDGSITLKASVMFDEMYNLEDYDIIVTHVSQDATSAANSNVVYTFTEYGTFYAYENIGASLTSSTSGTFYGYEYVTV